MVILNSICWETILINVYNIHLLSEKSMRHGICSYIDKFTNVNFVLFMLESNI